MQDELSVEHPEIPIHLYTINEAGQESGIPDLSDATDLPILQDDATALVWQGWGAEWRDVYVLGPQNQVTAVYNLTIYDLSDPLNYDELKALLVEAWTAE